jgi:hypothetical protein
MAEQISGWLLYCAVQRARDESYFVFVLILGNLAPGISSALVAQPEDVFFPVIGVADEREIIAKYLFALLDVSQSIVPNRHELSQVTLDHWTVNRSLCV